MAKKKAEATGDASASDPPAEKITQKEAVKRALTAGKDTPTEGVVYIKATFGIDLSSQAFSTLKSQLKSASGASSGSGKKAAAPAGPRVGNGRSTGNAADLARSVKALVQQHGAEAVKDMATVFAE